MTSPAGWMKTRPFGKSKYRRLSFLLIIHIYSFTSFGYTDFMNLIKLKQSQSPFFTTQKVAEVLGISEASARVLCSRYTRKGIFLRLKKNYYIFSFEQNLLSKEELFYISNLIQTPSYISLTTALSYHGMTTQITRDVIEAINPIRSEEFETGQFLFTYRKIKPELYFGFERRGKFFIATKEKALLDALYLTSLGRYDMDRSSIDLRCVSWPILKGLSKKFPKRTQEELIKWHARTSST